VRAGRPPKGPRRPTRSERPRVGSAVQHGDEGESQPIPTKPPDRLDGDAIAT
jgi:hypothetical protein